MHGAHSRRMGSSLASAAIATFLFAAITHPARAAGLCWSNVAGDRFVVHGIGAKMGKKKSKPLNGYAIASGGGPVKPVTGAYVTNAEGTVMVAGLTEHYANLSAGGVNAQITTKFHQIYFVAGDGKLSVGRVGHDCAWLGQPTGNTSALCVDLSVIDCKTVPSLP